MAPILVGLGIFCAQNFDITPGRLVAGAPVRLHYVSRGILLKNAAQLHKFLVAKTLKNALTIVRENFFVQFMEIDTF